MASVESHVAIKAPVDFVYRVSQADSLTEARFRYTIIARPKALRWLLEPLRTKA